jgi:hypothetical protein
VLALGQAAAECGVTQATAEQGSAAAEALPAGLAEELTAAAQCCKAAVQAMSGPLRTAQQAEELLVPAAEGAAAALHRFWALPAQAAADRLALACAAAARSCANLRCPTVSLEGGPGARQGVGCKRCSGCAVAR